MRKRRLDVGNFCEVTNPNLGYKFRNSNCDQSKQTSTLYKFTASGLRPATKI